MAVISSSGKPRKPKKAKAPASKKNARKCKVSEEAKHPIADLAIKQQQRIQAAHLLAEGKGTLQGIADSVGVDQATLYRWRRDPAFKALVIQFSDDLWGERKARALGRLDQWLASSKFEESMGAIDRILAIGEFAPPVPPAPKGGVDGSSLGSGAAAVVVVAGKDDDWTRYVTDRVDPPSGSGQTDPSTDGGQGPLVP